MIRLRQQRICNMHFLKQLNIGKKKDINLKFYNMNILLLGSGGRAHALAWKIAQSPKTNRLYIAPGNDGTAYLGENIAINAEDFNAIGALVRHNNIDMVVVGPEAPLVEGITDC